MHEIKNIKKLEGSDKLIKYIGGLSEKKLYEIIKYADNAYYNTSEPIFSDTLYDTVREHVSHTYPSFDKIGSSVGSRKVKLPYYMGSMNKYKEADLINSWKSRYNTVENIIVSDKLDGNSCMIVFKENEFRMYTRGNGTYGLDITEISKYVSGIPTCETDYAIRGEMIISKKDFEKVKEINSNVSNARNTVAGILNSKSPDISIAKYITFVAYEVVYPRLSTQSQFDFMDKYCVVVYNENLKMSEINEDTLHKLLVERKSKSEYEIDGIIVECDRLYNVVPNENPKYAFAYKSDSIAIQEETTVVNVEWNISKDLLIKPVVVFENVCIGGVNISRATGYNAKYIIDNGIGIGSRIVITRSGDVIPKIVKVIQKESPLLPEYEYSFNDTQVDIIAKNNSNESDIKQLTYFFTKIHSFGMSVGIVKKLYNSGFNTIGKIISVSENDLCAIDGFKITLASKVVSGIRKALDECSLVDIMVASNTYGRGIGEVKLKALLEAFPEIVNGIIPTVSQIANLANFDLKTAERVITGITNFTQFINNNDLIEIVNQKKAKPISNENVSDCDSIFNGKSIVFTGIRNKELEKYIILNGGTIKNNISKNSNMLIVADTSKTSSKITSARNLGIQIVAIKDILEKCGL